LEEAQQLNHVCRSRTLQVSASQPEPVSSKPICSGVTDGGQGARFSPWQAKCKNWAHFGWHFEI